MGELTPLKRQRGCDLAILQRASLIVRGSVQTGQDGNRMRQSDGCLEEGTFVLVQTINPSHKLGRAMKGKGTFSVMGIASKSASQILRECTIAVGAHINLGSIEYVTGEAHDMLTGYSENTTRFQDQVSSPRRLPEKHMSLVTILIRVYAFTTGCKWRVESRSIEVEECKVPPLARTSRKIIESAPKWRSRDQRCTQSGLNYHAPEDEETWLAFSGLFAHDANMEVVQQQPLERRDWRHVPGLVAGRFSRCSGQKKALSVVACSSSCIGRRDQTEDYGPASTFGQSRWHWVP
ncbi:uncharacterized protein CLUP02_06973 [Colletotrichum lupini]|uniref:Uncharacterized protein n=1 Tax=Colletotrichum lupini TaxID=145971 RepID=A0A9Q8WG23_9PEZI|nr:uncharacterized protein CLUP02_06973 [Colletotrichum lupini]UQC81487.1 hypothetical protein CLUP02_06973 [Colletotrichum lupini]